MRQGEKVVEIGAKLYAARKTVRSIYGARYEEKLKVARDIVRAVAKKHGCDVLQVPLKVRDDVDGMAMLVLLAAVVEEVENPS